MANIYLTPNFVEQQRQKGIDDITIGQFISTKIPEFSKNFQNARKKFGDENAGKYIDYKIYGTSNPPERFVPPQEEQPLTSPDFANPADPRNRQFNPINQIASKIGGAFTEGIEREGMDVRESFQRQQQGEATSLDTAATALSGAGQVLGETAFAGIGGVASAVTPDIIEDPIKSRFKEGLEWLSTNKEDGLPQMFQSTVLPLFEKYEQVKQEDPTLAQRIDSALGITEMATMFMGAPAAQRAGKKVAGAVTKKGDDLMDLSKLNLTQQITQTDDVAERTILQAIRDGETSKIREIAERTAPKVSYREKVAGVRPDIKARIAGKKPLLQEYFDVAAARNFNDTLPTPLEHAAKRAAKARDEIKNVLDDTGSKIGQFRNKISKVRVGADDMDKIQDTFIDSLGSLNLGVKNGKVQRLSGKVKGKVSNSEIKALQEILDDIQSVKGSPKVENLIDLRNAIQSRINFAKTAREASGEVDPIARQVRGIIRDINLKTIGREQGALLDDYSNIIDLYTDLNKAVESKSGAEFLLKRVLSERGRVPRETFQKVADITGIDLMDDATMSQLAIELIGNPAQKGLFRQEITKAGLDAMDIVDMISGAPGGTIRAAKTLMEKGKGAIANPEKMFLKAAE